MDFDNSLFENTPIEFKEINHTDFDSEVYNVEPKEIVKPNEEGYLSDNLIPILTKDLQNKNTTVINAGVGQGKTKAIIKVIKKFADDKDYLVVIAVPFKSLIQQYEEECIKNEISKGRIFNQLELGDYFKEKGDPKEKEKKGEKEEEVKKESWGYIDDEKWLESHLSKFNMRNYDIHILTINALLGNSVQSLFQSKSKTEYFNRLLGYCEKTNKKLILLFDEIHAGIHNFKEEFICKLWNYHGLVHKNYIISATYNEASKEVIKYLSEFTDHNVKIIESTRKPLKNKQSELFLNFYIDRNIEKDETLYELILDRLENNKKFDILVYSRKLAEMLTNKKHKIGQLLEGRGVEINKSINDPFNADNESIGYDKNKINIGTKFSTGINIEYEEHTFIILFPKDMNADFIDNKGIFTMGSNSIVQALARQREKGEIHLFLPLPMGIESKSLPTKYTEPQKKIIVDIFEKAKNLREKTIRYSNINEQSLKLKETYNKLYNEVLPAIRKIDDTERNSKLNRLLFPTQEIFNLDKGEKHLVKIFFGGDLPGFILWASLTNQFLNCRLKDIDFISRLYLDSKTQYKQLEKKVKDLLYEEEVIEENYFYNHLKPSEKIIFFKKYLSKIIVFLDNKKLNSVGKEKVFLEILKIILFDSKSTTKDEVYHLYLKSCLINSSKFLVTEIEKYKLSKINIEIIEIYAKWKRLKDVLELNIETYKKHNFIHDKAQEAFIKEYKTMNFNNDIDYLLTYDALLSTGIFPLKNTFQKEKTESKKMMTIYKLTIKLFYANSKKEISVKGKRTKVYLLKEKSIEPQQNLLFKDLALHIL